MKAVIRVLWTTTLGGLFFLLPIVVLVAILAKALDFARQALRTVTLHVPVASDLSATATMVLLVAIIVAMCFFAGLLARTIPAQHIVRRLESTILSKVPVYEYLKAESASALGLADMTNHPVVLAYTGSAWQIGVQTDVLTDGFVAVFVPNAPNPKSGVVFCLHADRVRPTGIKLVAALNCLRRYGEGLSTQLKGAPSVKGGI